MYEYLIEEETGHALIVKDGERWAEFADKDFGKRCYELLMSIEVDKLREEMKKE
jgi:hypothetical protein